MENLGFNSLDMDISLTDLFGFENEKDLFTKQAKVRLTLQGCTMLLLASTAINLDEILTLFQSPEEIEKLCTKEDMPEVKRCVFLLKKGYEAQKISVSISKLLSFQVINHLYKYMQEPGSNEELLSLIVVSILS